MTSLQHAFDTNMNNKTSLSDKTEYDTYYAIDMIEETVDRLHRTKEQLEASIVADLNVAKLIYSKSRRSKAITLMQRVHKNKAYKEVVSAALFQLVAVKIELELQPNQPVSIEYFDSFVNHTIERVKNYEYRPVSDAMLGRKLARMVGSPIKAGPTISSCFF